MARHTIPDTIERSAAPPVASRPLAVSLVTSLRPYQWTKNLIIFAALLFGQRLLDGRALLYASAAFAIFCALSGVVYLINDIADREADRQHPVKKHRPIASGALPVRRGAHGGVAADGVGAHGRILSQAALRRARFRLSGAAGALLRPAQAHRHHRRADDCHRVRAPRSRGGRGDRRRDQPLAATS